MGNGDKVDIHQPFAQSGNVLAAGEDHHVGFIIQRINDESVKTIDDLQKIVKAASTSKDPVLYIQGIYPTGKKGYFAVPLNEE